MIERGFHKLLKMANSHIFDIHVIICGSLVLLCYVIFLNGLKKSEKYDLAKSQGRLLDILICGISGILYMIISQISSLIYLTFFSTLYASLYPMGLFGIKRHLKKSVNDLLIIFLALIVAIVMFCLGSCENNHFKFCILLKSFICAMGTFETIESIIIFWRREE